jgi:hypothetical protein
VFDLFLYITLAVLSLVTTYLGGHMALAPPETARAKNLYRYSFVAICFVSLTIIIIIGIRQYQAAAKADATQKELQDSIGEIRKQLQSAEVSRRLTGEGFLETKKLEVFPGNFTAGNMFRVNVETHNGGAGRVTDPLTVSWMYVLENAGSNPDRTVREKFEEMIKPYRAEYFTRKPQSPEVLANGSVTWVTREYQLSEGDVEALIKDTKRLYLFIFYGWTDSQGRKVFASDCRYLQAETLPKDYKDKDVIWVVCTEPVETSN